MNALEANKTYRVLKDFTDYYSKLIQAGTKLTFISQSFVPYHGGYTFQFAETTIYFQEEVHAELLDNLSSYLEEIPNAP